MKATATDDDDRRENEGDEQGMEGQREQDRCGSSEHLRVAALDQAVRADDDRRKRNHQQHGDGRAERPVQAC